MSTPYFHGDWQEVPNAYGVHYIPIYGPGNEEVCRVLHEVRSMAEFETSPETGQKMEQAERLVMILNGHVMLSDTDTEDHGYWDTEK